MRTGAAALRGETVVRRSDGVLTANIEGESVLLDPDSGLYYALNLVGTTVWSFLEEPLALAPLVERVATELAIAKEVAWRDCVAFLEDLEAHGLVELQAG